MKESPSLQQVGAMIGDATGHFFRRFHLVLYMLTVVIGVAFAIYLLSGVMTSSSDTSQHTQTLQSFDKKTITELRSFSAASEQQQTFVLPSGRTNPFE